MIAKMKRKRESNISDRKFGGIDVEQLEEELVPISDNNNANKLNNNQARKPLQNRKRKLIESKKMRPQLEKDETQKRPDERTKRKEKNKKAKSPRPKLSKGALLSSLEQEIGFLI